MATKSDALVEALSKCMVKQPFFAVLLLDLLTIKETETAEEGMAVPTAGTDGKDLFINKEWFAALTIDERVFLLCHEVMHVVLRHPIRGKLYHDRGFGPDLKPYNHRKMNVAQDYIINDWIIQSGQNSMPHGGLHNPQYDMNWLADELYLKLPDDNEQKGGADGSGNWDIHMPAPGNGETGQATTSDIQRALKSAEAAAKSQGLMPGGMGRLVSEICEPQVDWAEQLKLAVTTSAGRDDNTWARPNRKRLALNPQVYMPGSCSHRAGCIVLVDDSSGSISNKELAHFHGEMAAIVDELSPEECWISDCDTQCYPFMEVESSDDVTNYVPRGGGGTHMPAIFDQIKKEGIVPDCLVILTDGYTDYGDAPGYDVIWVMTTDEQADHGKNLRIKITGA